MESTESQNHGERAQMHKIHKSTKQQTGQKIPTIVNGQTQYTDNGKPLASNIKNNFQTPITNRVNKSKEYSKCSKHASQKQHKVVILGDSHARGCAAGIKDLLGRDFEVFGSINPGDGVKTIKDTANMKVQQLKARLHGSPRLINAVESTKVNRVNSSFQRRDQRG
jgi:UDP-N-acetyl-D-mannosaminuronic acid transferase (WecB/TagA/CpsF family)